MREFSFGSLFRSLLAGGRGEETSLRHRLLGGGAWAISGRSVSVLQALFINALLARFLTHEEMGTYFLIFSVVSFGVLFAGFGLPRMAVRFIAEALGAGHPSKARAAVRTIVRLEVTGIILVSAVLALGGADWLATRVFSASEMSDVTSRRTIVRTAA